MADARSKLADALANAETKRVSGGPPAAPKPATKSAPRPAPPARKPSPSNNTSAPKPKKAPEPKKQKIPKPKKTGPGASGLMFKSLSNFANNVFDELKTATSEISPAALLSTATDSIQSIKKAVGFDNDLPPHPAEQAHNDASDSPQDTQGETSRNDGIERAQAKLPSEISSDMPQNTPATNAAPTAMTSPAKVQRMASKKKKDTEESSPVTAEVEPSQEDLLNQLTSDTPTSPAKVVRAASAKKKTEDSEPALLETEQNQETLPHLPTSDSPEQAQEQETTLAVATEASLDQNQRKDAKGSSAETKKNPAPKAQSAPISKTEHAVRSFQALQILLTNPIWAPIITDPEIKPSSLYAPRENFDTNFSDVIFRDGLKAASRLASSYGFEPEKMRFSPKVMEHVKNVALDPDGKIKSYTQNISSAIGEEKVKEVMGIFHNKNFKHLLFSVSTRMGSFVPTIESVARIYLSLRKKEPLSSGDRLQIQEEIMMRYRKAPYTDEMGKKARNLALNYFMDHLSTHTLKLYEDRFKDAPEGQDNRDAHERRHATIKAFCFDIIDDWAKKVALSSQAIMSIQAKFSDLADQHLEETLTGSDASENQEN